MVTISGGQAKTYLEKARDESRKASTRRFGRTTRASGSTLCGGCFRHFFHCLVELFTRHLVDILQLLIRSQGKFLKGLVVRQAFDNDLIRHVIRDALHELIHEEEYLRRSNTSERVVQTIEENQLLCYSMVGAIERPPYIRLGSWWWPRRMGQVDGVRPSYLYL